MLTPSLTVGDLSGGQAIARSIRKAYSLPESGEGSAFYEFYLPNTTSSTGLPERADLNETKKIKEWFRAGLDAAGELMTEEERLRLLKEAKDAFVWNIGVRSPNYAFALDRLADPLFHAAAL